MNVPLRKGTQVKCTDNGAIHEAEGNIQPGDTLVVWLSTKLCLSPRIVNG